MPAPSVFEYAVVRVVPAIERDEFRNAAVLLLCRERRFLGVRQADAARFADLGGQLDLETLHAQLAHLVLICVGGKRGGPIGALPIYERFRWLAAPRSTAIQPGPVHSGLTDDPAAALDRLAAHYLRM